MNNQTILNTALEIAKEAGDLLRQGFGAKKEISHKSSAIDVVTQYDLAAEALITGRLQAAYPAHSLFAEEQGGDIRPGSLTWYVDPLDGTVNFAHGFPIFCVSMALYDGPRPLLGVVYAPISEECFYACAGEGAWLAMPGREAQRLTVSQTPTLIASLLATGFPYDRHTSSQDNLAQLTAFLKRGQGIRRAGSAALDLAWVAAGRYDGYWEFKLSPWDVAAGVLLVQEAGGMVSLTDGRPFQQSAGKTALVASNGHIHPQMLAVLAQVGT